MLAVRAGDLDDELRRVRSRREDGLEMTRVGLVGLGNMGRPIGDRLAAVFGRDLIVWARSAHSLGDLADRATIASDPAELAASSEILISLLPDVDQFTQLFPHAVMEKAGPTLLVISSTSSPESVRRLRDELDVHTQGRVRVVDAPVSGGTDGARAGTLSVMVGGDEADVQMASPVLQVLGTPRHLGALGSGQVAKACNQMVVAATIFALGEATALASRAGLDVRAMWELLSQGYAGSRVLTTRMSRLVEQDYTVSGPARFMVKDLSIALQEGARTGTSTELLSFLLEQFSDLVQAGFGDLDIAVTRAFVESR
jgi:2-hydroxy-3-oxopropionate reductase